MIEKLKTGLTLLEEEIDFLKSCLYDSDQDIYNEVWDIKSHMNKMKGILKNGYNKEEFVWLLNKCKRHISNIKWIAEDNDNREAERNAKSCLKVLQYDIEEYL